MLYGSRLVTLPSTRRAAPWPEFALATLVFLFSTPCHAALRACRPTDKPLLCRLDSILTFLYAAAAILGLLLCAAVLAAVRTYKRKARKITPDEITPDAQ